MNWAFFSANIKTDNRYTYVLKEYFLFCLRQSKLKLTQFLKKRFRQIIAQSKHVTLLSRD